MFRRIAALSLCCGLAVWFGCGASTSSMESAEEAGMGASAEEPMGEALESAPPTADEAPSAAEESEPAKPAPISSKPPTPAQPSLLAPSGGTETEEAMSPTDEEAVVINTNKGRIVIELYPQAAPEHVANFKKLVRQRFYEGAANTFHRYVEGFVVQGGDPKGDGTGGPGYKVPAEIGLKHEKGSVAAARQGNDVNPERESSGSQFYICLEELPQLDGAYSVFGKVIAGMDVVTRLRKGDTMTSLSLRPRANY